MQQTRLRPSGVFVILFLSTFGYFLLGRLGLLIALPPGYATVLWPASGFALYMLLRYGHVSLIGIFAGSLLTNSYTSSFQFSFSLNASFIALGSTFQIYVLSILFQRYLKLDLEFESPKKIVQFCFLLSPFACLVSPIIGTSSLFFFGLLNPQQTMQSFLYWWFGDYLGVLLFFPFCAILRRDGSPGWRARQQQIFYPTLLLLIAVFATITFSINREENSTRFELTEKASDLLNDLEEELLQYEHVLRSMQALLTYNYTIDKESFQHIAHSLAFDLKALTSITYVKNINSDKKNEFEREISKEYNGDVKVYDLSGQFLNSKDTLPIAYIYPEQFTRFVGLNIASVPGRLELIQLAQVRNVPVASDVTQLSSGLDKRGILIAIPAKERERINSGTFFPKDFIIAVIDFDAILQTYSTKSKGHGFFIEFSGASTELQRREKTSRQPHFSASDTDEKVLLTKSLLIGEKTFTFKILRNSVMIHKTGKWETWLALVLSLLWAGGLQTFFLVQSGSHQRIASLVNLRTKELKESELRASTSRDEALLAKEAQSLFIAKVSHELRTPLNGILGLTEILKQELNDEHKEITDQLQLSGKILLSHVNDILDFSKIKNSKITVEDSDFRFDSLMREIHNVIEPLAKSKGLRFVSDAPILPKSTVHGDRDKIRQIIINLLGNAVKFTERGEVKFEINCSESFLFVFVIQDTGIGFDTRSSQKLFEPFYQTDNKLTRNHEGTGLGLAIAWEFCQALGGTLDVESEINRGAKFRFTIRLKEAQYRSEDEKSDSSVIQNLAEHHPLNILVVEDNMVNTLVICRFLENLGYSAAKARNGSEALEACSKESFDLIFMDVHMPVLDGISATLKLRENKRQPEIIVAMTASALQHELNACRTAGMNFFLSKPITPARLLETLQEVIRLRSSKAQRLVS